AGARLHDRLFPGEDRARLGRLDAGGGDIGGVIGRRWGWLEVQSEATILGQRQRAFEQNVANAKRLPEGGLLVPQRFILRRRRWRALAAGAGAGQARD